MPSHLVHRLLSGRGERLADFGSEFGLRSECGHSGSERDLFLGENFARSQIFPDHFEGEVYLEFARIVVASFAEDALSQINNASGQTCVAPVIHDSERGPLLNLLLDRFSQLQIEASPKRCRFKHGNLDGPNLLIVRGTDHVSATADCRQGD